MLIWYKTSIIRPELHNLAKMASLAKIRQFLRKLHRNGKRKVVILTKTANLATILQSFIELLFALKVAIKLMS